jgi:serine protease Do
MQVLGRLALVALLASGTVLIPATGASANPTFTPEEKAAAIVRPAVLYIEVQWEGWVRDKVSGKLWDDESVAFAARCSGFAVSNDGYIVTAGHCVDPGVDGVGLSFFEEIAKRYVEAGVVKQSDAPALVQNMVDNAEVEGKSAGDPAVRKVFAQRGVAKSGLTAGEAMAARVVSFRPVSDGDVALLKVEKSNQPMVKLADSSDVSVGTDVLAIGYPASADAISDATFEPSNKDGKISNKRTENGLPFYETSAATTQGMSGGPVANLNGEIIGLISHGPAGEKQAFNFLAASSLIAEGLGKSGVNNDLGKIDKDYRDGLDAYYAGRYTSAIEKFDAVLVAVPSHAQAQEFQQKAVALSSSRSSS